MAHPGGLVVVVNSRMQRKMAMIAMMYTNVARQLLRVVKLAKWVVTVNGQRQLLLLLLLIL